jgi:hypothetical protein
MERKVQQDSGGLENNEIVSGMINEDGDSAIWVELDEPGLFLPHSADYDVLIADGARLSVNARISKRLAVVETHS